MSSEMSNLAFRSRVDDAASSIGNVEPILFRVVVKSKASLVPDPQSSTRSSRSSADWQAVNASSG